MATRRSKHRPAAPAGSAARAVGKPRTALRARCHVRLDRSLADLGGLAASLLDDVWNGEGGYTIDVLLTDAQQRVTYGEGADKALTVVHQGAQGAVVWDHATRSVARIPVGGMPGARVASDPTLTLAAGSGEKDATFVMTTNDPAIGTLRHEVTVSPRKDLVPFGPALMRVLHCGPACHANSGVPWDRIASAGLIVSERTFAKGRSAPVSELVVESIELVRTSAKDFEPPAGYQPLEKMLRMKRAEPPPAPPRPGEPPAGEPRGAVVRQALEGTARVSRALRINEKLTPDCLGSTRFGAVTATLQQDFFTLVTNTVNLIAPLIGPTTIGGGVWRIPWLANLAAITPNAPGSGIFSFLRQPRTVGAPPSPGPGGGGGLLDRLAFRTLYERDATGLMRTQRDFAAGTLGATLASWGAGPPASTNLVAAAGDLSMLSLTDQQSLTEAYEAAEPGVITIPALPATLGPIPFGSITMGGTTTPPMFTIGVTGIGGTVNFASLGGGPLITTATIGGSGNVVLGFALPTVTATGTITRATTPFGNAVVGISAVAVCFFMPFLCPLIVILVALASFVLNNVTVVTATATGVTWSLDVTWDFDPITERVEPFVTLLGRTGVVTMGTFGPTPNIIANAVDSLIAALGNLFDAWGVTLAIMAVTALQEQLRLHGIQLPVGGRQSNLKAIGGTAISTAGSILQLEADIRPVDEVATQPFTTQVATRSNVTAQLLLAHLNMHRDLNPQGPPPPPGPGPAVVVGTFAGLGVSQNALNYYLYARWIEKRFEITITDPPTIARFMAAAPTLFNRNPLRIHMWPAVPPRAEIAPDELASGTRPLIVFFDDVRACFEGPNSTGFDGSVPFTGLWELSCNFRAPATVEIAWPWVFDLRIDQVRPSSQPLEPRTWEFVDPNIPGIMGPIAAADLARLVDLIGVTMIAPMSTAGITSPNPVVVRPWTRPLPALQQDIIQLPQATGILRPQLAYVEMMARRKALYLLPAFDTVLFELVDGSGAFNLNTIWLPAASSPGPIPTTVSAMRGAQGAALRDWLLPLTGSPAGP